MSSIGKVLQSSLVGAVVCAVLAAMLFFLLTLSDGTQFIEAFGFSVIVGVLCAFVGFGIGAAVGIGNFGVRGGAIVGLLATVVMVAVYVLTIGGPGRYGYFLGASRIIWIVLTLPTILTGIITALFRNRLTPS